MQSRQNANKGEDDKSSMQIIRIVQTTNEKAASKLHQCFLHLKQESMQTNCKIFRNKGSQKERRKLKENKRMRTQENHLANSKHMCIYDRMKASNQTNWKKERINTRKQSSKLANCNKVTQSQCRKGSKKLARTPAASDTKEDRKLYWKSSIKAIKQACKLQDCIKQRRQVSKLQYLQG